ncbi:hypothetical protein YPPY14_0382, partial [Yersinia pestis PY-14]
MKYCFFVDS